MIDIRYSDSSTLPNPEPTPRESSSSLCRSLGFRHRLSSHLTLHLLPPPLPLPLQLLLKLPNLLIPFIHPPFQHHFFPALRLLPLHVLLQLLHPLTSIIQTRHQLPDVGAFLPLDPVGSLPVLFSPNTQSLVFAT